MPELGDACRGAGSTKIAEDSFNYLRAQADPVRNGKQGPLQIWHVLHTSGILEDAERCPLQATTVDEAVSGSILPPAAFKAAAGVADCSLPATLQQQFECDDSHSNLTALLSLAPCRTQSHVPRRPNHGQFARRMDEPSLRGGCSVARRLCW